MVHSLFHYLFIAFRAILKGLILFSAFLIISLAGLMFYFNYPSPLNFLVGAPFLLIGISMGLITIYEMLVGLFSIEWGKCHCPLCNGVRLSQTEPMKQRKRKKL